MSPFKKIIHIILTPFVGTCSKTNQWAEMSEDLGSVQKMKIFFHLKVCACCRNYKDQIDAISLKLKRQLNRKLSAEEASKLKLLSEETIKKNSRNAQE